MCGETFRHRVWSRLEPRLACAVDAASYLQAAADTAGELIEVEGSYSICTALYGNIVTVGASDRSAWDADQVEFDTKDGPCVEALLAGTVTDTIDLDTDRRWPAWATVARLLGFRSAAGVPADIEDGQGQRISLNLYARHPNAFDGEVMQRATLFIEEVARTIPAVLRIDALMTRTTHLEQALASRSTIDQALGVLMAQNQCSRDDAFGILRRASQNRNTKLRDVAALIIERFTGHPAADAPAFDT